MARRASQVEGILMGRFCRSCGSVMLAACTSPKCCAISSSMNSASHASGRGPWPGSPGGGCTARFAAAWVRPVASSSPEAPPCAAQKAKPGSASPCTPWRRQTWHGAMAEG
eukprot:954920-Pyramimonas_sp.AAC.1